MTQRSAHTTRIEVGHCFEALVPSHLTSALLHNPLEYPFNLEKYRGELKGSYGYGLLSRTQAGTGRAIKSKGRKTFLATTYKPFSESLYVLLSPNYLFVTHDDDPTTAVHVQGLLALRNVGRLGCSWNGYNWMNDKPSFFLHGRKCVCVAHVWYSGSQWIWNCNEWVHLCKK